MSNARPPPHFVRTERLQVSVYDVRGRLVSRVYDNSQPAGPHTVEWNGLARSGAPVAAGIYFMEVRAGETVSREKFVVLR